MNSFSVAVQGSGHQQPVGHHAEYLEAAPVVDVLHDQLAYLVAHADGACPSGCPDCARLEEVKTWLLLPFRAMPEGAARV